MDYDEWRECMSLYGKFFNNWLKANPPKHTLSLDEYWKLFKHWFYDIREDGQGHYISIKDIDI